MGLTFDCETSDAKNACKGECHGKEGDKESVALIHRKLWGLLRERLEASGAEQDTDGLKLLKGYADILSIITKTERLIWGMEEMALDNDVYGEDEIAEAMVQITLPQRAGEVMDTE